MFAVQYIHGVISDFLSYIPSKRDSEIFNRFLRKVMRKYA
ncbi:hypothetical protein DOT_1816 [Desulfosporosinus sp. OT]|nr:hypothetical protein DOT_1816 [Desulfosporosinus sp. OT]